MQQTIIYLMRFPGGENEGAGTAPENEQVKPANQQPDATEAPKKKGVLGKLRDALKDWSNDDQMDQQIDDATP